MALARLLGGYDAWNAAKQPAVQPTEPVQPLVTPSERFVKEGYASGRPWQDAELLNMDADQALYLNKDDYGRWMSLRFGARRARPFEVPAQPERPTIDFANQVGLQQANPIVAVPTYGAENPVSAQPSI